MLKNCSSGSAQIDSLNINTQHVSTTRGRHHQAELWPENRWHRHRNKSEEQRVDIGGQQRPIPELISSRFGLLIDLKRSLVSFLWNAGSESFRCDQRSESLSCPLQHNSDRRCCAFCSWEAMRKIFFSSGKSSRGTKLPYRRSSIMRVRSRKPR